jgi:predicted anti-sigma-YlaC factor YlaD
MNCDTARNAISARLDGEDLSIDPADLDNHLQTCPACRGFAREAAAMHREARVARAPAVPDLTAPILAAIGAEARPHAGHERALRVTLAIVGLVQLVAAVPALVLGDDPGLTVHAARHVGSFGLALAVGFLFAAWRPSRLPGLLPVVTVLVVCLTGTSVLDLLEGRTGALSETQHAVEVVGLAAAWMLAHARRPHRRTRLSTS